MKNKYNRNHYGNHAEENLTWAKEVLKAYNLVKDSNKKKEAWEWARITIFQRFKNRIYKRNLNFKSFSALITPLCHELQPKKKKVVDIVLEGAIEHQKEWEKECALLCRDHHGDPISA